MLAEGQTAVPASRRSLLPDDLTECCWSCFHVNADAVPRLAPSLIEKGGNAQHVKGRRERLNMWSPQNFDVMPMFYPLERSKLEIQNGSLTLLLL